MEITLLAMLIKLKNNLVPLVFGTDFHISDVPPGRRGDDYRSAILSKIRFMGALANKINGVALSGGDVFHHKKPTAAGNSLSLIEETVRILREFPLGYMAGCIGNHDISWDRMETLPNQPLGILIAAGVYRNIVGDPLIIESGTGVRVQVESYPYTDNSSLLLKWVKESKRLDAHYRVALLHAYGHPDPTSALGSSSIAYDPIGYKEFSDTDFDYILWGHDHKRQETVKVGKPTHIRLGSIARAALEDDVKDRPVSLAVLSFSDKGSKFQEVQIPVSPFESIFEVAGQKVEKAGKSKQISEFFQELNRTVDGVESNDPKEVLTSLCPKDDKDILPLAFELCEL